MPFFLSASSARDAGTTAEAETTENQNQNNQNNQNNNSTEITSLVSDAGDNDSLTITGESGGVGPQYLKNGEIGQENIRNDSHSNTIIKSLFPFRYFYSTSTIHTAAEIPNEPISEKCNNSYGSSPSRRRCWSFLTAPRSRKFWILVTIMACIPIIILAVTLGVLLHSKGSATSHSSQASQLGQASQPSKASQVLQNGTVNLGYTTYNGISSSDSEQIEWLGIRYAAPPTGDLRFRAPQPPLQMSGVQQADTYGPICLPTPSTGLTQGASEDCLFLNVYAPANVSKLHPVFVYIQGGGFNSNANPNLNGTSLVKAGDNDMVVVNFNYRVGPWGFLASSEVQANGTLNAGLLDQRYVLEWVQTYIHLFGGDPSRVTLGGDSAGAASVILQLAAYGGRNDSLFIAAAAESQSFGTQLTVAESQYQYDGLVERTGCNTTTDTLTCLRNLDVAVLAEHNSLLPTPGGAGGNPIFMYSNIIDGNFTQDYTYKLYSSGRYVKVPTIFGDDTNEGTIWAPMNIDNLTEMNEFLQNNFPSLTQDHLTQIDALYPNATAYPNAGEFWAPAALAYGEMRYNCPGIFMASTLANTSSPSYLYHWDVLDPANAASGFGVTHTAELPAIWGTAPAGSLESAQSPTIQAYWASFIRTQDPNQYRAAGTAEWTPFSVAGMNRLHFANNGVAMEEVNPGQQSRCAYLNGIGADLGI